MLDLRNVIDLTVENPTGVLDLAAASFIADEINGRGIVAIRVVLPALYERLFRRKGLYLALELLDFCVRNCGLVFARHVTSPVLKAMSRILQMSSMREQTLIGQLNSGLKHLILPASTPGSGSSTTGHSTRDVVLIRCQKKILYLIQLWADAFMLMEDAVPDILAMYRKLRKKGYNFPPHDPHQRFLVKHAESSPAFDPGNFSSSVAESVQLGGTVSGSLTASEAASRSFQAINSSAQRIQAMKQAFGLEQSQHSRTQPPMASTAHDHQAVFTDPLRPAVVTSWDRDELARTAERVASAVAAQRRPSSPQGVGQAAAPRQLECSVSARSQDDELVDLQHHVSKIVSLAKITAASPCSASSPNRQTNFIVSQIARVLPLVEQRIDTACRNGDAAPEDSQFSSHIDSTAPAATSLAQLNMFIDLHEELVHHYHRLSICQSASSVHQPSNPDTCDPERVGSIPAGAGIGSTSSGNLQLINGLDVPSSADSHPATTTLVKGGSANALRLDAAGSCSEIASVLDDTNATASGAAPDCRSSIKKPLPRLLSFDDEVDDRTRVRETEGA